MAIKITKFNMLSAAGDTNTAFLKALEGDVSHFEDTKQIIKNKTVHIGRVQADLPEIKDTDFNTRCNRLALKCLTDMDIQDLIRKYGAQNIAVVGASTNSGVSEYEYTKNPNHAQMGNLSLFIKNFFNLQNFHTTVSTACSSGLKAFSTACTLLNSDVCRAVIVVGADSIAPVPVFGFHSLEILSQISTNPFSKNRCGINLSEGAAAFILEKDSPFGITIVGIGESTDCYHSTTPDPAAKDVIECIENALNSANLKPENIDYINLHGTGTLANDLTEGTAINKIFKDNTPASSTKPVTGHLLGAAAALETALCCKLLTAGGNKVFPHIYDGEYDPDIPKIFLANKNTEVPKIDTVLCTSFGFGGANAAMVLKNERVKNEI